MAKLPAPDELNDEALFASNLLTISVDNHIRKLQPPPDLAAVSAMACAIGYAISLGLTDEEVIDFVKVNLKHARAFNEEQVAHVKRAFGVDPKDKGH